MRQHLVFLVWDELTTHSKKTSLSPLLPSQGYLVQPSLCGGTLSLYVYILFLFCVFIWGDFTGVTYLEHSLHVVYWPGTVVNVLGV